jgi:hypothetical protein
MFFEWWMIAIFIAASCAWGEYRYSNGNNEGITEAVKDVEVRLMRERVYGSYVTTNSFIHKGLIKIDEDGTFHGMNDVAWNPLTQISSSDIGKIKKES